MNKKNIIIISVVACIIILAVIFAVVNSKKTTQTANSENQVDNTEIAKNDDTINNKIAPEDIVLNYSSDADFIIDITDPEVRYNDCEAIIIGTVESIDGTTNYNPKKDVYTVIQTYGTVKVDKVIKGNIENNKIIPFIRSGGIISVSEYEKGLNDAQKEKINILKTMSNEEKKQKYVSYKAVNDIDIEKGKTYLMYLEYDEDQEKYGILYYEYGLMEADTNTINNDVIKVKDNVKQEWENFSVTN